MTAERRWRWMTSAFALAVHREQLFRHGGADGVRDLPMLESALARPVNLAAYEDPDAAQLAAAYAHGIARNHPFVDGNKRTALVVSVAFLRLNDQVFTATEAEASVAFLDLAAGQLSEDDMASWFCKYLG